MVVKRKTKVNIKKFVAIVAGVICLFLIFVLVNIAFKKITRSIPTNYETSEKIIAPLTKGDFKQELKKKLSDKNIIFESFKEATESGVFIGKIKDGPIVYFSDNKDVVWLVSSLQLITSRFTIEVKRPTTIDLRQSKPIVKFE